MKVNVRDIIAEILNEDSEELDPKFIETVRALKVKMPKLVSKKNKKLRQYDIGVIRPNNTVEDLVNALASIVG